jgi:hypothetical protein
MFPPPVRTAFAILAAVLVALTAAAPHVHGGLDGRHGCQACVTHAGAELAEGAAILPPLRRAPEPMAVGPLAAPPRGFPQGAVPGQSPPRA